jgi:hypothetical protein
MTRAAEKCVHLGQRLVLVIDGLDEDRGVTTSRDAHSIAELLPARPPAGMRVIVAGRPDPPVPADVPDDHPLRDPGILRALAARGTGAADGVAGLAEVAGQEAGGDGLPYGSGLDHAVATGCADRF